MFSEAVVQLVVCQLKVSDLIPDSLRHLGKVSLGKTLPGCFHWVISVYMLEKSAAQANKHYNLIRFTSIYFLGLYEQQLTKGFTSV